MSKVILKRPRETNSNLQFELITKPNCFTEETDSDENTIAEDNPNYLMVGNADQR